MRVEDFKNIRFFGPDDVPLYEKADFETINLLDTLVQIFGSKPVVTSTWRADSNFHKTGKAVDVEWVHSSPDQRKILEVAEMVGFKGIGYYLPDNHWHFDTVDRGLRQAKTWGHLKAGYTNIEDIFRILFQKKILSVSLVLFVGWGILKLLK